MTVKKYSRKTELKKVLLGIIILFAGGFMNRFGSGMPIWQSISFFICVAGLVLMIISVRKVFRKGTKKISDTAPIETV